MGEEQKKLKFKCRNCEKTVELSASEKNIPQCCEMEMEKMEDPPPCQLSATAEHARPEEMMEPCDDGRTGKI